MSYNGIVIWFTLCLVQRHPFKTLNSEIAKLYTLFRGTKQYYQLSLRRVREVSVL